MPDGGLRELYDRTVGYQASRPSPFSVWGRWSRSAGSRRHEGRRCRPGAGGRVRPAPPSLRQTAALGAAILIAVELTATHWFYLYVVWFVPFVFVALFAAHGRRGFPSRAEREPEQEREAVLA